MTKAADIAKSAYEQAKAAAEMEAMHEEAIQEDERRRKHAEHVKDYAAALPVLNEWFPGVKWKWITGEDYGGYDTIIIDASEGWPPSFKLRIYRRWLVVNKPEAGYEVKIRVGDYRSDNAGYRYFSGAEVKGPADVGRYLEARGQSPEGC